MSASSRSESHRRFMARGARCAVLGACVVALGLAGCSGHLITGEPVVYGVDPLTGEIIDRDVVAHQGDGPLGVLPHRGEIITLVVDNVFLRYLEDLGSPHVLVYAEVFDDGSDDPGTAITKVLFNERDQPSGVNLGLADRVLYGPTAFKGFPIRVKFYIVELDREEKETASKIIDAAGAIASTAKPEAGPAIAIGLAVARALNELNTDDYELRFDLTLFPVSAFGSADVTDDELAKLPPLASLHRQGKPVAMAMPLHTGSYVVIKRELEERLGKSAQRVSDVSSMLQYDWSQRVFAQAYEGPDGAPVLSREVLRLQGGYLYRIVREIRVLKESPVADGDGAAEAADGADESADTADVAATPAATPADAEPANTSEAAAAPAIDTAAPPAESAADEPTESPWKSAENAPVRLRRGPNRFVDFSLQQGLRQRFDDQTYVTLSILQGLPAGLDQAALRAASERDVKQLAEVLDNPGRVPAASIGARIDELAESVKGALELRHLAEAASRRVAREPEFRASTEYPLFWTRRIVTTTEAADSAAGRAASVRNQAILGVLADLILNVPPLATSAAMDMQWLQELTTDDVEPHARLQGLFRLTDAAIARRNAPR